MIYKFIALFALIFVVSAGVLDLTGDNFHSVVDGSKPAFVEFFAPWCGHCKRFAPDYETIGTAFDKFKDRVVVAKVDCDAESNKKLCADFGIQGFPTLNWFPRGETKNPTKYGGGRTIEEVIKFINENAGVSARIPGKEPSYVVDLTDDTFDSVVLDKKKNVFVEFYAPWCGHCKSLAPVYEKLAKVYANDEDVVIARIDADANKGIGGRFSIQGFPTLKWFSKNNKAGEEFSGGRDLAGLVQSINEKWGTLRNEDGQLVETAGRVEALDEVVRKLKTGSSITEVKASLVEAASTLGAADQKYSKIYIALADKYTTTYVETEIARLTRLISSGSITAKKADDFSIRINILKSFQ